MDVLAHQGGWDEALFLALPVLVFVLLLVAARRRAPEDVQEGEGGPEATDMIDGSPR